MYCGGIYDNDWEKKLLNAGNDGLSKPYTKYQVSTGVGPCCKYKLEQELAAIRKLTVGEPYKK